MIRKNKVLICLLLVLTLIVSGVTSMAYTSSLTQPPSSWAVEYVDVAILLDLVPSNLQSQFTQPITRAEFAALAVTLYEFWHGEIAGRSRFDDTNDTFVQKAAYIGVVNGVGNNRFDPNTSLTREQAATMLSRLATAIGTPLPNRAPTFADNDNISYWARNAVGQVQIAEIMTGIGSNMFSARGPYTREQSIITIVRLTEFIVDAI